MSLPRFRLSEGSEGGSGGSGGKVGSSAIVGTPSHFNWSFLFQIANRRTKRKDGQWRGRGIYGFQMHGDLNACAKTKSTRMWKRVETREVRGFNDAYREQRKFDEGGEQI
jgi:hypothetical protein